VAKTKTRELNEKQKLFVRHLVHGASVADAYRLAGYTARFPDKEGGKLKKLPHIREAVDKGFRELQIEERPKLLKTLKDIAYDQHNRFTETTRMKALTQIQQMLGADIPVEKTVHVKHEDNRLPLQELLAQLPGMQAEIAKALPRDAVEAEFTEIPSKEIEDETIGTEED